MQKLFAIILSLILLLVVSCGVDNPKLGNRTHNATLNNKTSDLPFENRTLDRRLGDVACDGWAYDFYQISDGQDPDLLTLLNHLISKQDIFDSCAIKSYPHFDSKIKQIANARPYNVIFNCIAGNINVTLKFVYFERDGKFYVLRRGIGPCGRDNIKFIASDDNSSIIKRLANRFYYRDSDLLGQLVHDPVIQEKKRSDIDFCAEYSRFIPKLGGSAIGWMLGRDYCYEPLLFKKLASSVDEGIQFCETLILDNKFHCYMYIVEDLMEIKKNPQPDQVNKAISQAKHICLILNETNDKNAYNLCLYEIEHSFWKDGSKYYR